MSGPNSVQSCRSQLWDGTHSLAEHEPLPKFAQSSLAVLDQAIAKESLKPGEQNTIKSPFDQEFSESFRQLRGVLRGPRGPIDPCRVAPLEDYMRPKGHPTKLSYLATTSV